MQKILVFGKHGQVGSALVAQFTELSDQFQLFALDKEDLDLTQTAQIKQAISDIDPDWVINTAAYTAVDAAEADVDTAALINADAPQAMAEVCKDNSIPLIHYSTDYVFDGDGPNGSEYQQASVDELRPYVEADLPNPQSVYGRTKLAGELAVLEAQPNSIILRTAWVYAREGANFVNTMLRLGAEREELSIVSDQYGSPTLAWDLAAATIQIIKTTVVDDVSHVAGIYHTTNNGWTNWSGFAEAIFKQAGNTRIKINAIPSVEYPTPAPRPMYSVLSNQKLKDTFGIELPSWQDALERTLG